MSQKRCTFADVIELERHIEILLLSNDCVIVPDLGGFMAHHIDAHYDEQEHIFLPPQRTLGFNPQLKLNDSLLAQSYVEAYDISYPEALRRIEAEVAELKQYLTTEGFYELNDIGCLSVNDEGKLEFEPCEAGILTPELYGLSSFELTALNDTKANSTNDEEEQSAETEETTGERAITIKMTWVRNAVAVAAILIAVFILALPTGKTDMMQRTISNINNGLLFGMTSKDTNTSKIEIKRNVESEWKENTLETEKTAKADSVAKVSADSTNLTPPSTLHTPQKGYCIVLASYVSMRNANAFIERLQKQGYDQAEIFERNSIRRVIYGHYPSENDAYNDLRRFHRNSETAEAWVMEI